MLEKFNHVWYHIDIWKNNLYNLQDYLSENVLKYVQA